ncbi:polyketide synthase [Fusarium napiforme]|uniref:Polyketide synthase n=1 Tax=Fusarium napiforme TaxID=42672 RepID=A0A8H5NAW8_9HYPO|nr:polyketide synthase [Fusarium napiforme]
MAGNAPGQSVLEEARPTVRLKGKEGQYAETLEYDTFQSRGGNPEDLMDEERWLDFPAHVSTPLKKVKIQEADRDGSLLLTRAGRKINIWSPDLFSDLGNNRISRADTGRKMAERHLAVKLAARACQESNILTYEKKDWLDFQWYSTRNGQKDQLCLCRAGDGPAGVAKTLPSNEEVGRKPLICRAIQDGKDYNNLHFTLKWPPMALLEFPKDMIKEMQRFLKRYPSDNVPLNIALAAAIIYFDIGKNSDHQMEDFLDSYPRKPSLVQKAPLATFIIYFPHMLKTIGPVFPDIGSDYYNTEVIASCTRRWFGNETYYTQNLQFCLDNPELERKNMATRADELIRIADRLGIPPNERKTSHKTMLLEWDGMEEQLRSLGQEGKLKRLAAPEYYTPPAKRAQPAEPTLSSDIKGEIFQTIKGLAAVSCDWDNLLKDLQTPAPTMKAIQKSFSHVRLFVSELEKTLQNKNHGNGKGDLDHVIRLVFRAEGLFGSGVEVMDYESKWSQHRARLSQLFGQPTGDAIEAVFRLRDTSDAFGIILPQIQVLGESPLIKDQVEAFKKIEGLLGQPLADANAQTDSGGRDAQQ